MRKILKKTLWFFQVFAGIIVAIVIVSISIWIFLHTESPLRAKVEIHNPGTKQIDCRFYVWTWQLGRVEQLALERCGETD